MIVCLPKRDVLENNNLFNCNLNSLKNFFPPTPFPDPKETNIFNISDYLNPNNTMKYIDKFNEDMKKVGKFRMENLYLEMVNIDLGIPIKDIIDEPIPKFIFDRYYNNIMVYKDSKNVSSKEIEFTIDKLYEYQLLSDKNLTFAKDELKRMRLSTTFMNKRLIKDDKNRFGGANNKSIAYYTGYLRFILETYENYISDKTLVSSQIYISLAYHLKEFFDDTNYPIPHKLFKLIEKEKIFI